MVSRVDPPSAIECHALTKHYGTVQALKGINLRVGRGEMFALLGPNGAGKTTLFSLLATLRSPSSGSAQVLGYDIMSERAAIRRRMGIVFQESAIDQRLPVRDNLLLMGLFYGLSLTAARHRSIEVLETLGLQGLGARPAQTLSGGQRRRVELARALVAKPDLLFLDESTLGLDVDARRSFWAEIRSFVHAGGTVFFTTHYMEEADVADRIALMDGGQIIAIGSPQDLKKRVGGGVILLHTEDDEAVFRWFTAHGKTPQRSDRGLLVVDDSPATLLPELLRTLPTRVLFVEVHEPSLEDAFLTMTGRGLGSETRPSEASACS